MVTLNPLACRSFPSEAEIMPFPSEEVTPPVTNMYLVVDKISGFFFSYSVKAICNLLYFIKYTLKTG